MRKHVSLGATPVSDYPDSHDRLRYVSASDIIAVLRADTIRVGAARLDFAPEDVGTHSLCSCRAMAVHINGVPDRTLVDISQ